jgi:hypothetical protein
MISEVGIEQIESPAFEGRRFGDVGSYERLRGFVAGELQLSFENDSITDLSLARRNSHGRIAYTSEFVILRPVSRGNGIVLYDVTNRGNKAGFRLLNFREGAPPGHPHINDPRSATDGGIGWAMENGYILVWSGWDATVPRGGGRLTLSVPVARRGDGGPIHGRAYEEIVVDDEISEHPPDRWHLTYAAADTNATQATLRVSGTDGGKVRELPPGEWQFIDPWTIGLLPEGVTFRSGLRYEFFYTAVDPLVLGIGFAAVRDLVSFLRYETKAATGAANPLATRVDHAVSFGVSQGGRFHRPFLRMGMNADESGRRVFDGMLLYMSGAGGGFFNYRFGQPGRSVFGGTSLGYPEQVFPFAYQTLFDPISGETDGVLAPAEEAGVVPKIMEINDSNSYWFKCASLTHTTPDALADLPDPSNVRFYLLASIAHAVAAGRGRCLHQRNPTSPNSALRALLTALVDWIVYEVEPPPSRVPRISDGTLVAPAAIRQLPNVPRVTWRQSSVERELCDYGPSFSDGILEYLPPRPTGRRYLSLVPMVDPDGCDAPGIRLPEVDVPLGTLTGWNVPTSGSVDSRGFGSFIPFRRSLAERLKIGDCRDSLEERYGARERYVAAVTQSALGLVQERFLLPSDAEAYIREAGPRFDRAYYVDANPDESGARP